MSTNENKINHKELLTLSNLTNLEWEFVDLQAIDEGDEDALGEGIVGDEISTLLNDLLTPGVFVRRDEDGNILEYSYGEDESENYNENDGIIELRQEAGIAMEYLEKDEGNFIGD